MTKPEVILWSRIKGKQIGYKFRRQFSIGQYVVDFYCSDLKLIIEVDGESHDNSTQMRIDPIRQDYFVIRGFVVLRYTNNDVIKNLDYVVSDIIEKCRLRNRE